MASTNTTKIYDCFFAAISCLLLPFGDPLHDGSHQLVHAADRVHFLAAFAKCGMNIDPGAGDAHPQRAEVFEHHVHIGRLAKNAHVWEDAVIHEVMSAEPIAAIFLSLELTPL